MLLCKAAQARTGDDVAKCELATAPEKLPPADSMAVLAGATLGFLEELAQKLRKKDAKAVGALVEPPLSLSGRPRPAESTRASTPGSSRTRALAGSSREKG